MHAGGRLQLALQQLLQARQALRLAEQLLEGLRPAQQDGRRAGGRGRKVIAKGLSEGSAPW